MTSFFRRSTTLLVTGGAILGVWAAMGSNALALTQEQIVEQLETIPVFTITDERGIPYVAAIPNEEADAAPTIVTEVFISHEDAETSLDALHELNPDLADTAQVTPVSLARIYEVALMGRGEETPLEFLFVPIVEEVQFAMTLPNANTESSGVPLFMVSAPESPDQGTEANANSDDDSKVALLTLQNGDEEIVPLFFRRDQFDGIVESIEAEQPDFAANLELRVIWLEDFIGILERAEEGDADIQQYQMIPLPESIDFAQRFTVPRPAEANTSN